MLAQAETERTRLLVVIDAELRTTCAEEEKIVQEYIFSYLSEKVPNLPRGIFEVTSYDHDSGMFSSEMLQTTTLSIWSERLTEPDANTPGRSWSLELAVGKTLGREFFGSRLSCFSRHLDFSVELAVPRVYRDLVGQNVLYGDGIRLSRTPFDITTDDDVEWLVALINNPKRRRNIIALSSNEYGCCSANPKFFSDRLCGVAHVVRIYPEATFRLSELIGRYLSVFDLGIRIYVPTASLDHDDPLRHTLYSRHALAQMNLQRVQHSILVDAFAVSVQGALGQSIPTFAQRRSR
jgi:hypothetical protein